MEQYRATYTVKGILGTMYTSNSFLILSNNFDLWFPHSGAGGKNINRKFISYLSFALC